MSSSSSLDTVVLVQAPADSSACQGLLNLRVYAYMVLACAVFAVLLDVTRRYCLPGLQGSPGLLAHYYAMSGLVQVGLGAVLLASFVWPYHRQVQECDDDTTTSVAYLCIYPVLSMMLGACWLYQACQLRRRARAVVAAAIDASLDADIIVIGDDRQAVFQPVSTVEDDDDDMAGVV